MKLPEVHRHSSASATERCRDRVERCLALPVPARHIGDTSPMVDRNVLGGSLEPCGTDPVTGFYRDGCCTTGPEDHGSHTICAVVTAEFLEHQRGIGNDLTTPMPHYGFPGLAPGDRWCDRGQLAPFPSRRGGGLRGSGLDARARARDRASRSSPRARRRRPVRSGRSLNDTHTGVKIFLFCCTMPNVVSGRASIHKERTLL